MGSRRFNLFSVGKFLAKYKSGKVPKPFKVIPSLVNWEAILDITEPEKWSPAAVFEATKFFAAASPDVAQSFYLQVNHYY